MKKTGLFAALFFVLASVARADEGMWLPQLLAKLNESRMKSLGMKISAEQIYSVNKGSLKDAVVSFGGFCTGEIISTKGLVLTNHHCGFDAIQNHSTLQNNYIRDGFWAKSFTDEIPNKGLFATFIERIDDVTDRVMIGVNDGMNEADRQTQINKNISEINKTVSKEKGFGGFVRGFFEANQYYLFTTRTYNDVRLVGAPPSAIGNFGKDTDNWMWPRHTGDFSMFRIYAGKNNEPADYAADNVPFTPKRALNISLAGVKENDFTMVFGFPGRTTQYLHSEAIEQIRSVNDPAKIAIRDRALKVIDSFMRADEGIKIQYAAKYASVQNAYKKWQGEVLGLTLTKAVDKKKSMEAEFQRRVDASPSLKVKYGTLLSDLAAVYAEIKPYALARDYYTEIVSRIELGTINTQLNSLVTAYEKSGEKGYNDRLKTVKENLEDVLKEYNPSVDRELYRQLSFMYLNDQPEIYRSNVVTTYPVEKLYTDKRFYDQQSLFALLNGDPATAVAAIKASDATSVFSGLQSTYQTAVMKDLGGMQARLNVLQRKYTAAQLEVFKEKTFYPDANSTMRVAFGQVKGYAPRDGVKYDYKTDLSGVMEKYKPGDYEFDVPEKLRTLYANKDFGRYGTNGTMPVCFIATNHTTGGNSGSPALDANGNLIGLNFDRVWEGTMSDINYDPSICRNIMVDIRYVLFVVDKFAGATRLVKEMNIVGNKTNR